MAYRFGLLLLAGIVVVATVMFIVWVVGDGPNALRGRVMLLEERMEKLESANLEAPHDN